MRYLLYGGSHAYPKGGWRDYAGSFASLRKARDEVGLRHFDWWHIVDRLTLTVVEEHE